MIDFEKSRRLNSELNHYHHLQNQADTTFQEIASEHKDQMRCFDQCYSCCKSGLSISLVEAYAIFQYLYSPASGPSRQKELLTVESIRNGRLRAQGYCPFLTLNGKCGIYPVRPLVCRGHGLPQETEKLNSQENPNRSVRVCEKNFKTLAKNQWPLYPSKDFRKILNTINRNLYDVLETKRNQSQINSDAETKIELAPSKILEWGTLHFQKGLQRNKG